MQHLPLILLTLTLITAASAQSTTPTSQPLTPDERWNSIAPFFTPPKEFANQLGDFRSVMTFDDGTSVTDPKDWPRRRKEIRAYWDAKLGAWPPLLEKPAVEYVSKEHLENFTRHKIKIQLAQNITREAYLLVPDESPGAGAPFPAVISVFYTAETSANIVTKPTTAAFGYDLAKRGFITLCLGSPDPDVRKPDDHPIQPLMFLAYVAVNAHAALAQMPNVDPNRIGIIGHSFGGKWAMFASCLYDKFAAAVWCDPGIVWNETDPNANYWEPWYLGRDKNPPRKPGIPSTENPRTGPYKLLLEEHHDLHELHALMAPRPFLVSGGEQDQPPHWIPLNHAIALNQFLGHPNRVALTSRIGHSPTPQSNEQAYRFLEHFLKDALPK
jgi:hypothetical protein